METIDQDIKNGWRGNGGGWWSSLASPCFIGRFAWDALWIASRIVNVLLHICFRRDWSSGGLIKRE